MAFASSFCAAVLAAALAGPGGGCTDGPPAILAQVHRAVMSEAVYVADPPGQDIWRASTVGDCEDFALEMRRRLIVAGVPAESMTVLVTWNRRYRNWHAALLARTGGQAWLLDSLQREPRPWDGKGIEWALGPQGRRLVAIDGRPIMTGAGPR